MPSNGSPQRRAVTCGKVSSSREGIWNRWAESKAPTAFCVSELRPGNLGKCTSNRAGLAVVGCRGSRRGAKWNAVVSGCFDDGPDRVHNYLLLIDRNHVTGLLSNDQAPLLRQ